MKAQVLLVNEESIYLSKLLMQLKNYQVNVCSSISAAWEYLKNTSPDLILLGIRTADDLQEDYFQRIFQDVRNAPVIVLMAGYDHQLALELIRFGAQDVIPKGDWSAHSDGIKFSIERVLERWKCVQTLTQSEDLLRQQSEAKSQFLAHFSHEIRTPLNTVVGISSLLDEYIKPEGDSWLNSLKISTDRLLAMVDDILDTSKIEAGKIDLHYSMVDIRTLVESVVSMFGVDAGVRNICLSAVISSDVPVEVSTDKNRLKQIISNLVSNALKFTEEGSVLIHVDKMQDGELTFRVKDTGCGIQENHRKLLFEPFVQVGTDAGKRGTGLGLLICRTLTRCLGGDISVRSQIGIGSEFTFSIKYDHERCIHNSRAQIDGKRIGLLNLEKHWENVVSEMAYQRNLVPEKVPTIDDAKHCDYVLICPESTKPQRSQCLQLKSNHSGQSISLKLPLTQSELYEKIGLCSGQEKFISQSTRMRPSLSHRTILVVDDDPVSRCMVRQMLAHYSIRTLEAANGQQAIEVWEQNSNLDAIFMDCSMPVLDGFEATKLLREKSCQALVVALTGYAFEKDRQKCLSVGMDKYLRKPIKLDHISELLTQIFPQDLSKYKKDLTISKTSVS